MEKLGKLYEGKAKKLYATNDPEVLWVEYTDQATAGNGAKKASIGGKARLNNTITATVFALLASRGIDSHFIATVSPTEQLVKSMTMFPLEIIVRNVAAGSFAKRYGLDEGTPLSRPILEFCVKNDELGDPFITADAIVALGIATDAEINEISRQAFAINDALCNIFSATGLRLIDFKIEEGKTADGTILLADEITPDTCRLWADEDGTIEHLDKDLFRRSLGDIIPAYEDVLERLTALAATEHVDIR